MKCENWSNKVNNFVVRKLKSFKLNGQQQVLSTMPAMPKEKTSPVPLTECNFVEMKMKEQLVGSSANTTTTNTKLIATKMPENILTTSTTSCSVGNNIQSQSPLSQLQQQQQQQHQQQQYQHHRTSITTTPIQQTKLYSSPCNDICSSNNSIRTSINDNNIKATTTTTTTGTGTTITELITSSNTPLLNGSTTNLYNSKNDMNNKNLSNGTMNTIMTGLLENNCCNDKNTIRNNLLSTSTATSNGVTNTTIMQGTNESTSSSSSSSTTFSPSQNASTSSTSTSTSSSITSNAAATSKLNNTITQKNNPNNVPPIKGNNGAMPAKKSAKDYIFGKIIGEGSFSTVCLARDIHTNREYAIKICYKPHILREKKQEYVRREREVMHIMNNVPGFVNLSCTFQDYRNLYFVMTLAKNGDLLPYINKVGSFDLDCTRHYAAELVLAIENMHKRGVIHRDLKPENILLDENMHTLIADFGSAKVFDVNGEKEMLSSTAPTTTLTETTQKLSASPSTTTTITPKITTSSTDESPIRTKSTSSTSSSSSSSTTTTIASRLLSTTTTNQRSHRNSTNEYYDDDNDDDDDDDNDSPRPIRRRKGSFVGTAQYVSPEVLQGEIVTRSADLWALGCIIYQMISGLPPFRGGSDYLIFKEIMNLNLLFPEGFDKDAEDLVRKLLKINPSERIGANNSIGKYDDIRSHPFFNSIEWDKLRQKTPPQIYPYLPGTSKDEELRSHYRVPDNLEPGLDDKQLTRLLGLELGTLTGVVNSSVKEKKTEPKNNLNITENEKQKRLDAQKYDKWHPFSDGEIILKKGFVNKRKGLFARKRMLLLTTGPRLIYIDPVQMVKKGEIPWSSALRVEPKNFKIFFVHTPNRTYYLEDPEGYALEWVNAIEDVRQKTYGDKS